MNANDKLKKWLDHNYLIKRDERMITNKTSQKDDFLDSVYDRISEGKHLDTDEIEQLIYDYRDMHVDEIPGDDLRWVKSITSIIKIRDKYFAIDWFKAPTEYQENGIDDQPYEVKKVEKMVPVTEWIPVKQDS